jgi:hypothetical protein
LCTARTSSIESRQTTGISAPATGSPAFRVRRISYRANRSGNDLRLSKIY